MNLEGKNISSCKQNHTKKLTNEQNINDLKVIIDDINNPTLHEIDNIKQTVSKFNLCIYSSKNKLESEKKLLEFVRLLGMKTYDCNNIDNGPVSKITNKRTDNMIEYIPYTSKKLNWHTDGYYNNCNKLIFSWLLHCVEPAKFGGENFLLDHHVVYEEYIKKYGSLCNLDRYDAFTIPENNINGRPSISSYIFSKDNSYNQIHMKFSMRKNNININKEILYDYKNLIDIIKETAKKKAVTTKLNKNEGLVTNNVLHGRNEFSDGETNRTLLRIRSYEKIQ